MVTTKEGLLTTQGQGSGSTSANRVLVDYKDALQDYRVTALPAISLFAERFTTETGGDIDITFAKQSMNLEQIEEGTAPKYQSTDMRNERINVKEWGIAIGVTRRMMEDSRFSEIELALNEARRAVDRHVTAHAVKALFGVGDATFGTGMLVSSAQLDLNSAATCDAEAEIGVFSTNPHGAFFGEAPGTPASGQDSRLTDYGLYTSSEYASMGTNNGSHYISSSSGLGSSSTAEMTLGDITTAIELIGSKGLNADTIMISPSHYKVLLDLADFTVPFGATASTVDSHSKGGIDYVNSAAATGLVGQIYGLNVMVNAFVPMTKFGVFDMSVKPMAYVERRGLTVEEANPGFGIVGSYMSMRYGLKIVRPEAGVIVTSA
jgi:hypothetical protein|tara:strand:- start:844 stop:1974 length:1131 start_codon:yes stop_codon:yes gene_type:complete